MRKIYKKLTMPILLFCVIGLKAQQPAGNYAFSESTEGYSPVVGTVSTATGDDGSQNSVAMPFPFKFEGVTVTSYSISTNGFIRFNNAVGASSWTNLISNTAAQRPFIAPFWDDNNRNTGSIQYVVNGTSPNRTLEIGWDSVNIGGGGATSATLFASFKVRLYETTDVIEFIYGSTMANAGALTASVGLNGSATFLSVTPGATSTTSNATANNSIASTVDLVGKKFIFTPPAPPACVVPSGLTAAILSSTSVNLGWTENGTATMWNIEWDTVGFTPTTGNMITGTSTNPHTLSGLSANTSYQFYVQADCGGSGTSSWAGPFTFTTPCNAIAAPWLDDVEAHTATTALTSSNCWTASTSGAFDWDISGTGTTPSGSTGPLAAYSGTKFFFTEASNGNAGEVANLVSPLINLTALSTPILEFYYHMFGAAMGNLYIDVYSASSWTTVDSLIGQQQTTQGDAWTKRTVNLSAFSGNIQVRFRAIRSTSFTGDISIDNVEVKEAPTCLAPSTLMVSGLTPTSVNLGWNANGSTLWNIEWDTTGFIPTTGNMITGSTTNPHSLSGLTPNTSYQFYVQADCGGAGTSTWSGPFTFTTSCNVIAVPFTEGFETSSTTIGCWSQIQEAGTSNWSFATGAGGGAITTAQAGTRNARFVSMSGTNSPITKLVSPTFDLTTLTTPELSFYYGQEVWSGDQNKLKVYYRISGASPWVEIFVDSTNIAIWTKKTIVLPNPSATYQIAFEGINNWGYANVIDEVEVKEAPTCIAPTALMVSALTASSVDLGWNANGTTTWNIEWDTTGFAPTTGNMIAGSTTNPQSLSGLAPSTSYQFYVQADCGVAGTSTWSGPYTFITPCAATAITSFPWSENFDAETVPNLPCGWIVDNANADAYTWGTSTSSSVSAPNAMRIRWNTSAAMNDWAFTPEFNFVSGQNYKFIFSHSVAGTTFPEKLKVMLGSTQNSAGMTSMLFNDTNMTNTAFVTDTIPFTVSSTGSYFIGFHGYSIADMFAINIDDVMIVEDVATGIEHSIVDQFTIYPNPNNGVFTLNNVSGDNASIEIYNIQGKVVYKNIMNNSNQTIDLSGNAKGMYFINISTTKGTGVHKIVIQ